MQHNKLLYGDYNEYVSNVEGRLAFHILNSHSATAIGYLLRRLIAGEKKT